MIPTFLANATEDLGHSHSVADALPHIGGMLMVLATLAVLWGICALTAKLVSLARPPANPAPVASAPAATALPTQPAAATAPELVAVIAAAVAAAVGPDRRIVSIRPESSAWAKAGRQSVLSSHRIR